MRRARHNAAMCTNYTPTARVRLLAARLGLAHLPEDAWPPEVFPGFEAPIVVRGDGLGNAGGHGHSDSAPRCLLARFGLVPRWSKDAAQAKDMARRTYNARSETAAAKPSYRGPWHARQWALVPMENFFEPCWEDAPAHDMRAVRWRIARADSQAFAVAGLWERWADPAGGDAITSFTLLTTNADGHPLLGRMHRPGDEKRAPVIVPPDRYEEWLNATPEGALAMMGPTPAQDLLGEPVPRVKPVRAESAQATLF